MNQKALVLNERVQNLTEHVKVLKHEAEHMSKIINLKRDEHAELSTKVSDLKKVYTDINTKLKTSRQEVSALILDALHTHTKLNKRERQLEQDIRDFEDYKNSIYSELDTKQKQTIDKIDELNDTIKYLKQEIDDKVNTIEYLSDSELEASKEAQEASAKINELNQDIKALEEDKIKLIKGLQETTSIVVDRIELTQSELEDKLGAFKRKQAEFEAREATLQTREDNLKILTGRLQTQINEYFPTIKVKIHE
jgi:chromosome segregation ATPase